MGCLLQLSKYEDYNLVNIPPAPGQKAVGAKGSQILKISSILTAHCRWETVQGKFQVNKLSYKCYQILWMSNGWNPRWFTAGDGIWGWSEGAANFTWLLGFALPLIWGNGCWIFQFSQFFPDDSIMSDLCLAGNTHLSQETGRQD